MSTVTSVRKQTKMMLHYGALVGACHLENVEGKWTFKHRPFQPKPFAGLDPIRSSISLQQGPCTHYSQVGCEWSNVRLRRRNLGDVRKDAKDKPFLASAERPAASLPLRRYNSPRQSRRGGVVGGAWVDSRTRDRERRVENKPQQHQLSVLRLPRVHVSHQLTPI